MTDNVQTALSDAARAAIFGQIGRPDAATRRQAVQAALAAGERGPQPRIAGDLAARFVARAEALASTCERLPAMDAVPAAMARYLEAQGLGRRAVATPEIGGLDWAAAGLEVEARPAVDADMVGVTGADLAIAETGTLMLLSSPQSPSTVSLLPETHIVIVRASRLVATLEEAFARLRAERGELPRAVNFISGPSRTGDIEQTIVLGAHGPCRVHLMLIED